MDNEAYASWCFEESLLDQDHCVCVARDGRVPMSSNADEVQQFEIIGSISNLLEDASPLTEKDLSEEEEWNVAKEMTLEKPF